MRCRDRTSDQMDVIVSRPTDAGRIFCVLIEMECSYSVKCVWMQLENLDCRCFSAISQGSSSNFRWHSTADDSSSSQRRHANILPSTKASKLSFLWSPVWEMSRQVLVCCGLTNLDLRVTTLDLVCVIWSSYPKVTNPTGGNDFVLLQRNPLQQHLQHSFAEILKNRVPFVLPGILFVPWSIVNIPWLYSFHVLPWYDRSIYCENLRKFDVHVYFRLLSDIGDLQYFLENVIHTTCSICFDILIDSHDTK